MFHFLLELLKISQFIRLQDKLAARLIFLLIIYTKIVIITEFKSDYQGNSGRRIQMSYCSFTAWGTMIPQYERVKNSQRLIKTFRKLSTKKDLSDTRLTITSCYYVNDIE